MTGRVKEFVEKFVSEKGPFGKVLEVGSMDVNGNVRGLFKDSEYIGTDMREGPNVDRAINGHDLLDHFTLESFDCILCLETLEHDDFFWITIENMRKLLKPGGWLVITVPSLNHPRHNHPNDYWRFLGPAMNSLLAEYEELKVEEHVYAGQSVDLPDAVLAYGRKPLKN
jgi:predicted SAM-dependent methyltransferase